MFTAVECDILAPVAFGSFTRGNCTTAPSYYTDTCTLKCRDKYRLSDGSAEKVYSCQADRTWMPHPGMFTCKGGLYNAY